MGLFSDHTSKKFFARPLSLCNHRTRTAWSSTFIDTYGHRVRTWNSIEGLCLPASISSPTPSTTFKMEAFAMKIIEHKAGQMDDVTVLNFSEISRTIREKSHYIYGERFFSTLNFCLHLISLQALMDISNTPVSPNTLVLSSLSPYSQLRSICCIT
jgi:hypothetical protein